MSEALPPDDATADARPVGTGSTAMSRAWMKVSDGGEGAIEPAPNVSLDSKGLSKTQLETLKRTTPTSSR